MDHRVAAAGQDEVRLAALDHPVRGSDRLSRGSARSGYRCVDSRELEPVRDQGRRRGPKGCGSVTPGAPPRGRRRTAARRQPVGAEPARLVLQSHDAEPRTEHDPASTRIAGHEAGVRDRLRGRPQGEKRAPFAFGFGLGGKGRAIVPQSSFVTVPAAASGPRSSGDRPSGRIPVCPARARRQESPTESPRRSRGRDRSRGRADAHSCVRLPVLQILRTQTAAVAEELSQDLGLWRREVAEDHPVDRGDPGSAGVEPSPP